MPENTYPLSVVRYLVQQVARLKNSSLLFYPNFLYDVEALSNTSLFLTAFFDLTRTPMSKSIHTNSAVLADLNNMGIAFGISLLSFIEAEILRYFIVTSGNGDHL